MPGHTAEIADALNQQLSAKWRDLRGIEIVSFGVSSVKADEEDEKMIKELQRNAAFRNPGMAAAHLVGSQGQAMQDAAKNTGGAAMGFMGMNMAGGAGGMNAQNLFAMDQQMQQQQMMQQQQTPTPAVTADGWTCSCGAVNKGKFCSECGQPKPAGAPVFKCDKCGWEPANPANPPKFCPECGDPFDESDRVQ